MEVKTVKPVRERRNNMQDVDINKKDDFLTKETVDLLVSIGYSGIDKIQTRNASEWLESKYPNSILRKGYRLWREDLLQKAYDKYPQNSNDLIIPHGIKSEEPNYYYARREYIVRLAIEEIKNDHNIR